jgi:hypothetical protein
MDLLLDGPPVWSGSPLASTLKVLDLRGNANLNQASVPPTTCADLASSLNLAEL